MKSPDETFKEVKPWLFLGVGAFALYKFSGVFTAFGDTAQAVAEQATADVRDKAAASAEKSKIKTLAPKASDSDVLKYKTDAATIAQAFGTQKGNFANYFIEEPDIVFGLLKRDYSRLLLHNNKPYDKTTLKGTDVETKTSAVRKINWKVLVTFYKEESGRDLAADLKAKLKASKYQPTLKWIL